MGWVVAVPGCRWDVTASPALCRTGCPASVPGEEEGTGGEDWGETLRLQQ